MGLPSVPAPQPASVSTKAQPQHTLAPRMQPFLPRQDTPPARSKLTYEFAAVHRAEGPVGDDADRIPEEANVSVAEGELHPAAVPALRTPAIGPVRALV